MTVLIAPVVMFAAIRPATAPAALKPPECVEGQIAVALRLSQGTLALPLVIAGKEQINPLAVRADHFGDRFHKWVHAKEELAISKGKTLVWGVRLEAGSRAALAQFRWTGPLPENTDNQQFCIIPSLPGQRIGTGVPAGKR